MARGEKNFLPALLGHFAPLRPQDPNFPPKLVNFRRKFFLALKTFFFSYRNQFKKNSEKNFRTPARKFFRRTRPARGPLAGLARRSKWVKTEKLGLLTHHKRSGHPKNLTKVYKVCLVTPRVAKNMSVSKILGQIGRFGPKKFQKFPDNRKNLGRAKINFLELRLGS